MGIKKKKLILKANFRKVSRKLYYDCFNLRDPLSIIAKKQLTYRYSSIFFVDLLNQWMKIMKLFVITLKCTCQNWSKTFPKNINFEYLPVSGMVSSCCFIHHCLLCFHRLIPQFQLSIHHLNEFLKYLSEIAQFLSA